MSARKLNHDDAREALEMYKQNTPDKVLERKFNCSRVTIWLAIKRLGVEVPKRKRLGQQALLNTEQVDRLKEMLSRGIAKRAAARILHVGRSTVYRTLERSV